MQQTHSGVLPAVQLYTLFLVHAEVSVQQKEEDNAEEFVVWNVEGI